MENYLLIGDEQYEYLRKIAGRVPANVMCVKRIPTPDLGQMERDMRTIREAQRKFEGARD